MGFPLIHRAADQRAKALLAGSDFLEAKIDYLNSNKKSNALTKLLNQANFKFKYLVWILMISSALALFFSFYSSSLFLILIPVSLIFTYIFLIQRSFKRAEEFERDYSAFLISMSSAIKTGLDSIAALSRSSALFAADSELRKQIQKIINNLELGATEEEAINTFGSDIAHPDASLFKAAFTLARQEGSSLSQCLERLARVTRQRQSFRRKMRSALVLQRISALGICLCAFVIMVFQYLTNRDGVQAALENPLGIKLIVFGFILVLLGLSLVLKLSARKI